jgi:signal transduction histidine kinase/phage shock protein PspC (stress-responsive transcriptional regulator)
VSTSTTANPGAGGQNVARLTGPAAGQPARRPPLVRPRTGRKLGGVALGVSRHLDLPVKAVRVGFVVSALFGAAGLVLYAWLWALVPEDHRIEPAEAEAADRAGGGAETTELVVAAAASRSRLRADLVAGAFLIAAGAVLLGARQGWDVRPGLVLPLLIVAAGAVIAYAQFDEVDRARWFARTGVGTRAATLRLALGAVLVVAGILLLVVQQTDMLLLGSTLLAAVAVLVGVGVVFAPWGVRLWRDLDAERAARARESERADIAAHLHDSVLQTLALIQRRAGDGPEVVRLARAQERDLRSWLYGSAVDDPTTMAARVTAMTAEAEDVHGAVIEVVTVGDRPVDERTAALLAALREGVFNAARHADGAIRVYVESGPDGVEAFVRDRGPGFDLSAVPEDRLGVRESIIGRMERHGGSARVLTAPGDGTEVRLLLPDPKEES